MTTPFAIPQRDLDDPDWRKHAACQWVDPELWFPPGDDPQARTKAGKEQVAEAKLVCMSCEVRSTCLDYALSTYQGYGVWGGLDEDERRALIRRRAKQARAARQGVAS